ncbi:MAG: peptidase S7, partial [Bacillota bacterium]
ERANELGQGRDVGTIGFIDDKGYIVSCTEIINGGASGLPYRLMLSKITEQKNISLLEMINRLPDNSTVVSVKPGKTGIIITTGGINIFDLPIVKIGYKNNQAVGVGVVYPEKEIFNLASESELTRLKSLAALSMEEEKEALRKSTKLHLKYLDISKKISIVDLDNSKSNLKPDNLKKWNIPSQPEIKAIDKDFALQLVEKSKEVEQGREVAAFGLINENGIVIKSGEIVVGGMGYIPSRLLASGYQDISDMSLRKAYTDIIPFNGVIVHTHPGGTGVMHISDIMSGPGTWGRSIVAIGHDDQGIIKGVNVVEPSKKLFKLANEKEKLEQKFFEVNKSEEEVVLRKRRYEIAQEFTDLCREIEIIQGG